MSSADAIDYEERPVHGHRPIDVKDERGFLHDATITSPLDSIDLLTPVLMVGGIPVGTENSSASPHEYHPYFADFAHTLADHGITSMIQLPPGIGRSDADTNEESIASRIDATVSGVQMLLRETGHPVANLCLVGNSMGAHIVLRAAEHLQLMGVKVPKIVLLSPAMYDARVETLPFGESIKDFEKVLQPDFKNSPALTALDSYEGKVMLVYLKDDERAIMPSIQQLYNERIQVVMQEGRGYSCGYQGIGHAFRQVDSSYDSKVKMHTLRTQVANDLAYFISEF